MGLSPDQAAESLEEIERTARRSAQVHEYANASPGFILWGLMWMVGYAGSYVLPRYGFEHGINWLWFGLTIIGVTGSIIIGRRQHRAQHPGEVARGRGIGARWIMTLVALWVFVVASLSVLRPINPVASGAFIPLLVALAYALFGIWRGLRFLYAGIAVAALTLGGWFYLPQHFLLWMAAVGGGSLILVGLWLRRV
jgi:hypothetical protein